MNEYLKVLQNSIPKTIVIFGKALNKYLVFHLALRVFVTKLEFQVFWVIVMSYFQATSFQAT